MVDFSTRLLLSIVRPETKMLIYLPAVFSYKPILLFVHFEFASFVSVKHTHVYVSVNIPFKRSPINGA